MAASVDLRIQEFKSICFANQASPIVIANALPIGVPFGDRQVDAKRSEVTSDASQDHVGRVFSFDLISRVELVVMTGLDWRFVQSRQAIECQCKMRRIQFVNTAYFFLLFMKKIKEELQAH